MTRYASHCIASRINKVVQSHQTHQTIRGDRAGPPGLHVDKKHVNSNRALQPSCGAQPERVRGARGADGTRNEHRDGGIEMRKIALTLLACCAVGCSMEESPDSLGTTPASDDEL